MSDDEYTCKTCKKEIGEDEDMVGFDEFNFHKKASCFKCGGSSSKGCKKSLLDEEFAECKIPQFKMFPFHDKCVPTSASSAPAPSSSSASAATAKSAAPPKEIEDKCSACGKNFVEKEEYHAFKGSSGETYFHYKCFNCSECKADIDVNKPFGITHGKPFCSKCNHGAIVTNRQAANEFAEELTCTKCGERIRGNVKNFPKTDGLGEEPYHLSCAPKCSLCSQRFEDGKGMITLYQSKLVCHRPNCQKTLPK